MSIISASQIRAARGILDWRQSQLAEATGLSIATIRKIEIASISPRITTLRIIVRAFEEAGIEFIDPDGARRRSVGIIVYEGPSGGHDFLEDMKQTVRNTTGEVYILSTTTKAFANYCGLKQILGLNCLIEQNPIVDIKCLLMDNVDLPSSKPRLQFRTLSRNFVDPVPFCIYGGKYALAIPNGQPFCKLITVESAKMVLAAKRHFLSLWDKAAPTTIDHRTC